MSAIILPSFSKASYLFPLLVQSKLFFPLLFQRRGRGGLSNNVPTSFSSPSLREGRGGYPPPCPKQAIFFPPFSKEGQGWFVKQCPNLFPYSLPSGGPGWVSPSFSKASYLFPLLFQRRGRGGLSNNVPTFLHSSFEIQQSPQATIQKSTFKTQNSKSPFIIE